MTRRLVAVLACRARGTRLYGKPLQLLDVENGRSVLEHLVLLLGTAPEIAQIVLAIAEGPENEPFWEIARSLGVSAVRGDERDVRLRLILGGRIGNATDVFRVTTESPFTHLEPLPEVWRRHVDGGNDLTVIDGVPEGTHFEIYQLAALEWSHDRGDERHRSELCSLYIREHRDEFQVEVVPVPERLRRLDLRLTIDYPEDLIVCRRVYAALRSHAPRIPLSEIVAVLDADADLRALAAPYVVPVPLY
jgi:spore coat polysaccharide biosynthesis protein SpsF